MAACLGEQRRLARPAGLAGRLPWVPGPRGMNSSSLPQPEDWALLGSVPFRLNNPHNSLWSNPPKAEPRHPVEAQCGLWFAGSREQNGNNIRSAPSSQTHPQKQLEAGFSLCFCAKPIGGIHGLCIKGNEVSGSSERRQLPFPGSVCRTAVRHSGLLLCSRRKKSPHCCFKLVQKLTEK